MSTLARRGITRRTFVRALSGAAAVLASGRAGHTAELPDETVRAAKAEGQVSIYTAGSVPVYQEIGAAFEAKYGIEVKFLEARASEIMERIRTEDSTGQVVGDIVYTGSTSMGIMEHEGFVVPHGAIANEARIDARYPRSPIALPVHVASWALLANTDMVAPDARPKSWKDILDPRWRGKILMDDPRALGGGSIFFGATYETFGREFHEKLHEQNPVFSRAYLVNPQRVARGEFAIYVPMNVANYPRLKGLPVKLLNMEEGNSFVLNCQGLRRGAPHPNAAKLLMNYFLEEESQQKYQDKGWRPVITGIEGGIPESMRDTVNPKLMGSIYSAEQGQEFLKLANEIYK